MTNEQGMISELEYTSPLGNSDHCCIHFHFNCYIEYKKSNVQRFLYDKGNYEAMKEEINIDWERELQTRITVNEKWNYITKIINQATEKI